MGRRAPLCDFNPSWSPRTARHEGLMDHRSTPDSPLAALSSPLKEGRSTTSRYIVDKYSGDRRDCPGFRQRFRKEPPCRQVSGITRLVRGWRARFWRPPAPADSRVFLCGAIAHPLFRGIVTSEARVDSNPGIQSTPHRTEGAAGAKKRRCGSDRPRSPGRESAEPRQGGRPRANGTRGRPGGWVPSGNLTRRSPARSRSAAKAYAATTQAWASRISLRTSGCRAWKSGTGEPSSFVGRY